MSVEWFYEGVWVQLSNTIKLSNTPFQNTNSMSVRNNLPQNITVENGTVSSGSGSSSGTTEHNKLKNRDLPNQHPISSITGLQEELDSLNNGVVFIPSVSNNGIISWTNNGGLENPTPINIKGTQGERGEQGIQGIPGERGSSGVYVGSGDMPEDCNIQIDPSGSTEDYATHQYVDGIVGNIETALDTIISIQNSLIGGDNV